MTDRYVCLRELRIDADHVWALVLAPIDAKIFYVSFRHEPGGSDAEAIAAERVIWNTIRTERRASFDRLVAAGLLPAVEPGRAEDDDHEETEARPHAPVASATA